MIAVGDKYRKYRMNGFFYRGANPTESLFRRYAGERFVQVSRAEECSVAEICAIARGSSSRRLIQKRRLARFDSRYAGAGGLALLLLANATSISHNLTQLGEV